MERKYDVFLFRWQSWTSRLDFGKDLLRAKCTIVLRRVLRYSNMVEMEKVHCCKKKKWPWWGQRKVMNFFPQSIKRTIFGATMWWRTKRVLVIKWSAYSTRQRRKSRLFLTTHLNCFVLERTNDLARIECEGKKTN